MQMTIDETNIDSRLRGVLPITEKENYLNGCCHIFALALAEMTGLKVAAFIEERAIYEGEDGKLVGVPVVYQSPNTEASNFKEIGHGLIHAFCLLDDTSELIADASGIRHIDKLNKEYNLHSEISIEIYDDPNEVLKFGHTLGVRDNDVDVYVSKTKDYIKNFMDIELESILPN